MKTSVKLLWVALLGGCLGSRQEGSSPSAQDFSGAQVFDETVLAAFDLRMDPSDWGVMVANPLDDTYRRATMTWQGETVPDVGVRPSGQHSRVPGNTKPSLHLSFQQFGYTGRHWHGLPSLKLNCEIDDPSMIRERVTYAIARGMGFAAPRETHATLTVNGDYKGVYGVVERLTKKYLEEHFGLKTGQFYADSDSALDWNWKGPDFAYVPNIVVPKNENEPPDPEGIRDLVDAINNQPYGTSSQVFDVESLLQMMAIEAVAGEEDGYLSGPDLTGPGAGDPSTIYSSNYYVYKNPKSGKYSILLWDRDEDYWRTPEDEPFDKWYGDRVLTRMMILGGPGNLDRMKTLIKAILTGPGSTDLVQTRIETILAQLSDAIQKEPPSDAFRSKTYDEWVSSVKYLEGYISRRNAGLLGQLP